MVLEAAVFLSMMTWHDNPKAGSYYDRAQSISYTRFATMEECEAFRAPLMASAVKDLKRRFTDVTFNVDGLCIEIAPKAPVTNP